MAHNFANAYGNVKLAVEGLIAADPLRVSLNRASAQFKIINDDDFNKAPRLRGEFRQLRARLRRNPNHKIGSLIRSLENTDSDGMILLAENLIGFMQKMNSPEYEEMITNKPIGGVLRSLIRDPGPDNWDEEVEGD